MSHRSLAADDDHALIPQPCERACHSGSLRHAGSPAEPLSARSASATLSYMGTLSGSVRVEPRDGGRLLLMFRRKNYDRLVNVSLLEARDLRDLLSEALDEPDTLADDEARSRPARRW